MHSKNLEFMFAVVKIAGQQFKVQPGQNLYVPHLTGKSGDKVEFSDSSCYMTMKEKFPWAGCKSYCKSRNSK